MRRSGSESCEGVSNLLRGSESECQVCKLNKKWGSNIVSGREIRLGQSFNTDKLMKRKKKSLQTIFGFHAKNAAGDNKHGFATLSFKEWGAYATLARARTPLHIEMKK